MPRNDLDKSAFDCKKGDYCVGKANNLSDPTLQNRAQEYRRQISGKTRGSVRVPSVLGENCDGWSSPSSTTRNAALGSSADKSTPRRFQPSSALAAA